MQDNPFYLVWIFPRQRIEILSPARLCLLSVLFRLVGWLRNSMLLRARSFTMPLGQPLLAIDTRVEDFADFKDRHPLSGHGHTRPRAGIARLARRAVGRLETAKPPQLDTRAVH